MTSSDRLVASVIGALNVSVARLYEMKAAFGVVIVCAAFATTIEVMMATTVAMRMTPGRENFWIRILIAFILFGWLPRRRLNTVRHNILIIRPSKQSCTIQLDSRGN